MGNTKEQPSGWLLKNSSGKPDFLFTLLTYSFILLVGISMFWIILAIPALVHAKNVEQCQNIIALMANIKSGLISLAGLVFGLAGSYTVRRYQHDKLVLNNLATEDTHEEYADSNSPITHRELTIVENEEDI